MKQLTDESWFARSLAWLAGTVCRYRRAILIAEALLFVFSIWYTVEFLQLSETEFLETKNSAPGRCGSRRLMDGRRSVRHFQQDRS